jgi:hypothetical protein
MAMDLPRNKDRPMALATEVLKHRSQLFHNISDAEMWIISEQKRHRFDDVSYLIHERDVEVEGVDFTVYVVIARVATKW